MSESFGASGTLSQPIVYSSAIGQFVIGLSPIEISTAVPVAPVEPIDPNIARLYDNIQAVVQGATLALIEMLLWNTVDEFCIRSTYFRDRVYWHMVPGESQVNFNPYSRELSVVWVLSIEGLSNYRVAPPAILTDNQKPTVARTGSALVVLRPARFDNVRLGQLPELFTTWRETVLDGVLFRIYGMPGRPWSSQSLATYHGTRFRQGMNRARDIANRLHTDHQSRNAEFPYYARGRRKN